jgi:hypothetical protein
MTFPENAIKVVNTLVTKARGKLQKAPPTEVVIIELGVMFRRDYMPPGGDWTRIPAMLMDNIVNKYGNGLVGCKTLVISLDTYDNIAEHRVMVGQRRAKTPPRAVVDAHKYRDLTHRLPVNWDELAALMNNREWRQGVLLPFITERLRHPQFLGLERIYLRGFDMSRGTYAPETLPSAPHVENLLEMVLDRQGNTKLLYVTDLSIYNNIHVNASESDFFALSVMRWALWTKKSCHLHSGDGDLLSGGVLVLERFVVEKIQEIESPSGGSSGEVEVTPCYVTINTTKLGVFDLLEVREDIVLNFKLSLVTSLRGDPSQYLCQQMPLMFSLLTFLGENDTATPVPYITAEKITMALGPYLKNGGTFKDPPRALFSKDGKVNLLAFRPRNPEVFFYLRGPHKNIPQINFVSWLALIQYAGGFVWSPDITDPAVSEKPITSKPKTVTIGWLMAILLRLNYTFALFWHDHHPSEATPPLVRKNFSTGYSVHDGTYFPIVEYHECRAILEDVARELNP